MKNWKAKKSKDTVSIWNKKKEKKILRKIFAYLLIRLGKVENNKLSKIREMQSFRGYLAIQIN